MATEHAAAIEQAATAFDLDPDLLLAQVLIESSGRADAFRYEPAFYARYIVGHPIAAGAHLAAYGPLLACSYGLMQVLAIVAYEEGFTGRPEQLFIPEVGLEWGCRKFRNLLDWAHGNETQALAAYNAGRGNWESTVASAYVRRVQAQHDHLRQVSGGLDV